MGLGKNLAKLNKDQLQKALAKKGLSQKQIKMLMKKMAACRNACSRCNKMGQAMVACSSGQGGMSGETMDDLAEQLSAMDAMQQDMKLSQATLDEINSSIEKLGQCMGQGMYQCSGMGSFRKGLSDKYSRGSGGPGKGMGGRETASRGKTSTKNTKVKNKNRPGPIVASWYFKGQQIKGQARQDVKQVVQAAKKQAAEAISENRIPAKYKKAVKEYFGAIDQQEKNNLLKLTDFRPRGVFPGGG